MNPPENYSINEKSYGGYAMVKVGGSDTSYHANIGLRVVQLIEHHDARCAELLAACAEPRSAGELLSTLFPRPLDTHQVMFAMGEAIAHLNHLEHKGEVRKVEGIDGIVRFVKSN